MLLYDKANHPSFGTFRRFISSKTSRQVQVIDCRSSQNRLLDWLDDHIVLEQKPKDLETVRSAPSRRDSQSNSQRSMATLSQSSKSSWSTLAWFKRGGRARNSCTFPKPNGPRIEQLSPKMKSRSTKLLTRHKLLFTHWWAPQQACQRETLTRLLISTDFAT